MTEHRAPSPAKWPFFVADLALLAVAFWIVNHYPHPVPVAALGIAVGCVALAAFICVMPFRMQYEAIVRFAESNELNDTVSQINKAELAAEQIRGATAQWQGVQEQSAKTVATVREISDRMTAEAKAFAEFMQKANEHEKATLRLEADKLRRSESQWLQLTVHLLDHVYALHQAGARSGQPNLEAQLGRFREACYEAVRRVGLLPFQSNVGESYEAEKHQVAEGQAEPESGALIGQTLAVGYSFQGQLVRKSLVTIQSSVAEAPVTPAEIETEASVSPVEPPTEPEVGEVSMEQTIETPIAEVLPDEGDSETPPKSDTPFRLES